VSTPEQVLLWVMFGADSVLAIQLYEALPLPRPALLALATGAGALLCALLWFFLLALRRSRAYAIAMLIPYVNLIAAARFSRRYWDDGARAPAVLASAGVALQLLGSLGLLFPRSAVLV
jgi:hypothetical protein